MDEETEEKHNILSVCWSASDNFDSMKPRNHGMKDETRCVSAALRLPSKKLNR